MSINAKFVHSSCRTNFLLIVGVHFRWFRYLQIAFEDINSMGQIRKTTYDKAISGQFLYFPQKS